MIARIPSRRFFGEAIQINLLTIFMQQPVLNRKLDEEGYDGRRLLGYKVPSWQRKNRWETDQCAYFIESIWLGANVGAFMLNQSERLNALHNLLLDGLQRFRAIERYWNNEFTVRGDDGHDYLWEDLRDDEKAQFYRISFPGILTRYETEAQCKDAYNRHNYGGTPHLPEERAI